MKRILTVLLVLPLIFLSCGEDEDNFEQQNYLVGRWEITQIGSSSTGTIIYEDYENDTDCKDNYIFNSNLTYELNDYTADGSCTNTRNSGIYERLSNQLTLKYTITVDGNPQQVTIHSTVVSLTYTEVIIAYSNDADQIVYLKLKKV